MKTNKIGVISVFGKKYEIFSFFDKKGSKVCGCSDCAFFDDSLFRSCAVGGHFHCESFFFKMPMKTIKYESRPLNELFSITSSIIGDDHIKFCVDFRDSNNKEHNICFTHLYSAIDYLQTNFNLLFKK